jgi:hypothetical protein
MKKKMKNNLGGLASGPLTRQGVQPQLPEKNNIQNFCTQDKKKAFQNDLKYETTP